MPETCEHGYNLQQKSLKIMQELLHFVQYQGNVIGCAQVIIQFATHNEIDRMSNLF